MTDARSRSRLEARWLCAIASVAIAVYAWSIAFDFAYDDGALVVNNTLIRSLSSLPRLFGATVWEGAGYQNPLYRPLTAATFALNHAVSGLSPWSYHLVNVLLHGLASCLVFLLALRWRWSLTAAGIAGLLFAVHPVHVEAVANVTGRHDVLCAVFTLAVLLAHGVALTRGKRWLVVPLALYAAAMLSKEFGVVAPGLALAADLGLHPRGERFWTRRRAGLYAGYALVLALYLVLRWSVVGGFGYAHIGEMDNPLAGTTAGVRVLTAIAVLGRGFALLVFPLRLSPDYSYRVIEPIDAPVTAAFWFGVLVLGALTLVAVVPGAWRRRGWMLAALLLLPWLPASNLLFPAGTIFGERLLYLPSAAVCLAAGAALGALVDRRRRPRVLVGVALLAFAARTVVYAGSWKNDATLFAHAIAVVPESSKVQHKWGEVLEGQGRLDEAIAAYEQSLAILPSTRQTQLVLALAYEKAQRPAEATPLFDSLSASPPGDVRALEEIAAAQRRRGRLETAAGLWRLILQLSPGHAGALSDLGNYDFLQGRQDQAQQRWEAAVAADPGLASVWYNLAMLHGQRGETEERRAALRRFVEIADPMYAAQRLQALQELGITE